MPDPRLLTGGAYWRIFAITIPGSGSAPSTLLTLLKASTDYQAVPDAALGANPDAIVSAKLVEIASAINLYAPDSADRTAATAKTSCARAWDPSTMGDWAENVVDPLRLTWARSQAAGTVAAKLLVYMRDAPTGP